MSKKTKKSQKEEYDSKLIKIEADKDEERAESIAKLHMQPKIDAGLSILSMGSPIGEEMDFQQLIDALDKDIQASKKTDRVNADALLISQAHTLDKLFNKFIRKTVSSEYVDHMKMYSNIALKAQNQCRMTLGTLAEIKNPRSYIQNNKAQYQQVNNGDIPSHAGRKSKNENELLEDQSNEWMDTGTPEATSRVDKELETVGKEHRGKD